jgi:hypothetical protein
MGIGIYIDVGVSIWGYIWVYMGLYIWVKGYI